MRSLALILALSLPGLSLAAERFTLSEGDRVVLIGNALIEREQLSGWWELALTTRFAGKKITFRNLGWSGDDVFGTARAGFGPVAEGFKHLKEHTLSLRPTVLVIGYGNVEAFEGPAGKEKFRRGLETLLDTLAPAKARIVLLSPVAQAKLGKPLPDPTRQNANVRLYAEVVREVAVTRNHTYADLQGLLADPGHGSEAKTLDGVTLTTTGYQLTVPALERALGVEERRTITLTGTDARVEERTRIGPYHISAAQLADGDYTLTLDGAPTRTASAQEWKRGVIVPNLVGDPELLEKLRKLILAKNELYFYRWRPQNITYLTGFRRHEQGKNAREIPQFDPLVEAREKEIATLALPRKVVLELKPAKKK